MKDVILNFMDFFVEESCGSCTTCRALSVMYRETLKKIIAGEGKRSNIEALSDWKAIALASRCGLGHTMPNPVVSTIKNFRHLYEARIINADETYNSTFDLGKAVAASCEAVGRQPAV